MSKTGVILSKSLASDMNHFAQKLHPRLQTPGENVVFSPACLYLGIAMLGAGARRATLQQISEVLNQDPGQDAVHEELGRVAAFWNYPGRAPSVLRIANRVYVENGLDLEPAYLDLIDRCYEAPAEPTDFANNHEPARLAINEWVAEQTNHRIEDLLPSGSVDSLTRLVLVNAVYFLGRWATPFDPRLTSLARFRASDGEPLDLPFMRATEYFGYYEDASIQILEMSYDDPRLVMTVLLPRTTRIGPRSDFCLAHDRLDNLSQLLDRQRVRVELPRFRMSPPALELSDTLGEMGMTNLIDPSMADLGGIERLDQGVDRLFLCRAFHKAYVAVDELGTEAAAAFGGGLQRSIDPSRPPLFRADHPFDFLIRDRVSGLVFFWGRVERPRE